MLKTFEMKYLCFWTKFHLSSKNIRKNRPHFPFDSQDITSNFEPNLCSVIFENMMFLVRDMTRRDMITGMCRVTAVQIIIEILCKFSISHIWNNRWMISWAIMENSRCVRKWPFEQWVPLSLTGFFLDAFRFSLLWTRRNWIMLIEIKNNRRR